LLQTSKLYGFGTGANNSTLLVAWAKSEALSI